MRALVGLLVGMVVCGGVMGQNLVPNGGFEQYDSLPYDFGQWYFVKDWSRVNDGVAFSPSPDYFHLNAPSTVQLPLTGMGEVYPYKGEAIMGIVAWLSFFPDDREYISAELLYPMIPGETYRVTLFVTNGTYISGNSSSAGIDSLGFHLSVDSLFQTGSTPIELLPTLVEDSVIYSYGWQKLSYTITATDSFKYITIGNFRNDLETNVYQIDPPAPLGSMAYYFIDEVSVVHVDSIVGIKEPISLDMDIIPNPFSSTAVIRSNERISSYRMYSLSGRLAQSLDNLSGNTITIDRGDLPSGMYFIEVLSVDSVLAREKVIIQ